MRRRLWKRRSFQSVWRWDKLFWPGFKRVTETFSKKSVILFAWDSRAKPPQLRAPIRFQLGSRGLLSYLRFCARGKADRRFRHFCSDEANQGKTSAPITRLDKCTRVGMSQATNTRNTYPMILTICMGGLTITVVALSSRSSPPSLLPKSRAASFA